MTEKPSENVAAAVSPSLSKLVPDEVSLELFNSQYLQNHSSRGDAILAAAQASRLLDAPREEVEGAVFGALNADVELRLEVRAPVDPCTIDLYVLTSFAFCRPPLLSTLSCWRSSLPAWTSSEQGASHGSGSQRCSHRALSCLSCVRARSSVPSRRRMRRRTR